MPATAVEQEDQEEEQEEEEKENAQAGVSRLACKPINNLWFISARDAPGHIGVRGRTRKGGEGTGEISENISTHLRALSLSLSAEMTRLHISSRDANNDGTGSARWFSNEKVEFLQSTNEIVYSP